MADLFAIIHREEHLQYHIVHNRAPRDSMSIFYKITAEIYLVMKI